MRIVRSKREEKGWSQQSLAKKSGVAQTTISAVERGEIMPTLRVASRIAKALGCTVDELLGNDPSEAAG